MTIHVVPTAPKDQLVKTRSWYPDLQFMLDLAEKVGLAKGTYAWEGIQSLIILVNAGYAFYQWWQRRREIALPPNDLAL